MRGIRDAQDAAGPKLISAFFVVLLLLAVAVRSFAQTSVAGSITTAAGSVQLQRGGTSTPATTGTPVDVGDRVVTGAGGHAVITLTDGSQLELGESSNLVIDNQALAPSGGRAGTQVSLFGGILHSVVNATGGAPNFEVHTPNAVAAVRGTSFDTAYTEGESRPTFGDCRKFTDVVVYEGRVSVRNPGATTGEEVPAGYELSVPCNLSPMLPGPIGMTGARSNVGTVVGGVPPPACPVCPACTSTTHMPMPPPTAH
jgi:hypothetical protein